MPTPIAAKEKKYTVPEKTDFKPTTHTAADHAMREMDRVLRWKKIHKLLRTQNKKARLEQDKTAEDCKLAREEGWFKKTKSEELGLRFGVSLPPMVYNALVLADRVIDGHSDLANPEKEDQLTRDATNQIVKDLAKAFPQYKVVK